MPRYCTENFHIWLTFLYRNRGLPPLVKKMRIQDILNGTDSDYLLNIQRTSTKYGGDPTVRTSFSSLPYNGAPNSLLIWEVFSGDRNPDRARNILRYNQTEEFITTERQFYHVDRVPSKTGVKTYRKNPWRQKVFTASGTEGSQFMPDMSDQDDLLFYASFFGAMVRVERKAITGIYGIRSFVFETPINLYEHESKQRIIGQTVNNLNPYHNFVYDDVFNTSAVFGMSYFVTEAMFSRTEGLTDRLDSTIVDARGDDITENLYYNDNILAEPYSGIIIRGDTSYQMNFLYDSWTPPSYQQFLMPHLLYQRRLDIDGAQARDLFGPIQLLDERMRLILVVSVVIGGILLSGGCSLFVLTCFRNRQRMKLLKTLREEEARRKKAAQLKKKIQRKTLKKAAKDTIN